MEVKVNNKVRRIWNKKEWTPEMDAVVLRMADGETTIGEIAVAVTQETGTSVSKPITRKSLDALCGCRAARSSSRRKCATSYTRLRKRI